MDNSPFRSYLDTNYAPSEQEKLQIKELLVAPGHIVEAIDGEIAVLQQRIDDLKKKREEPARYVDKHAQLLAPVRGLPLDIYRTIFMCCVESIAPFPDRDDADQLSAKRAPMLLTFVCQSWRQIALACPSLWDSICITIPHNPPGNLVQNQTQLVYLWLSRAPNRPLTISLMAPTGPHTLTEKKRWQPLIEALTSSSSWWRRLRLEGDRTALFPFLSLPPTALLNLQNIDISANGSTLVLDNHQGFLGCSGIRGLRLDDAIAESFRSLPLHKWQHFTEIYISKSRLHPACNLSDLDILNMLSKCPSLVRCQTYYDLRLLEPAGRNQVVLLANLRSLHIIDLTSPPLPHLYQLLCLPGLTSLTLSTLIDGESMIAVVGQYAPSLRDLKLGFHSISVDHIVRLLRQVPQLETLGLLYRPPAGDATAPVFTDEVLSALTPSPELESISTPLSSSSIQDYTGPEGPVDIGYLCSKLREILLYVGTGPGVSDETIYEFIKERMRLHSPPLRKVEIRNSTRDSQFDVAAKLRQDGIDLRHLSIVLRYCPKNRPVEGSP